MVTVEEIMKILEAFFWVCGIGFIMILVIIIAMCLAEQKNDSNR